MRLILLSFMVLFATACGEMTATTIKTSDETSLKSNQDKLACSAVYSSTANASAKISFDQTRELSITSYQVENKDVPAVLKLSDREERSIKISVQSMLSKSETFKPIDRKFLSLVITYKSLLANAKKNESVTMRLPAIKAGIMEFTFPIAKFTQEGTSFDAISLLCDYNLARK